MKRADDTQALIERLNSSAIEWASKRWPHPWDYAEREAAEEAYVTALTDFGQQVRAILENEHD